MFTIYFDISPTDCDCVTRHPALSTKPRSGTDSALPLLKAFALYCLKYHPLGLLAAYICEFSKYLNFTEIPKI